MKTLRPCADSGRVAFPLETDTHTLYSAQYWRIFLFYSKHHYIKWTHSHHQQAPKGTNKHYSWHCIDRQEVKHSPPWCALYTTIQPDISLTLPIDIQLRQKYEQGKLKIRRAQKEREGHVVQILSLCKIGLKDSAAGEWYI
jgi:hypothetical protein